MLSLRAAVQRNVSLQRLLLQFRAQPHAYLPRLLCSPPEPGSLLPSEASIVSDLRRGDFERGIRRFCKRPRANRSNELHETVILACAQVPDAAAAEAVLRAMPKPTLSAVHNVVTALCREQNVPAAIDILEMMPEWGIPVDSRVVAGVTRAAQRNALGVREQDLEKLDLLVSGAGRRRTGRSVSSLQTASAADFFVEDGGDGAAWLAALSGRDCGRQEPQSRRSLKKIMNAEAALRAARGDGRHVNELWAKIQKNGRLKGELGVLAAAVSALVSSGWHGGANALNVLMTWVHEHLYDSDTGRGRREYTENASAMALLVTSASKAIAAAARPAPQLALSAFDALWKMDLPRFSSSLPLAGAYFKVLQHAELSLDETNQRIGLIRQHHIQLDEQGFSMALGAILRCDERVVGKLAAGKLWVDTMRQAGIPLTVQTYNLFAGQLRYCNDPEMVGTLLSDMTNAGVVPTPVTYGLVFSSCVIPGDYSSPSRKNALPVPVWESVLEAMKEHMKVSRVDHTSNSRLSLARAYAHLGLTSQALNEFDLFLDHREHSSMDSVVSRRELENAYSQMIFNFAHCRECSADGPEAALLLYDRMRGVGFPASGHTLDSALVACIRTGQGERALDYAISSVGENASLKLNRCGLKHLLMGHIEVCDRDYWRQTRGLVLNALDAMALPELAPTVQKLVIGFARKQYREVCDDMMTLAGIEISDLDYIVDGREFLRFRSKTWQERSRVKDDRVFVEESRRSDAVEVGSNSPRCSKGKRKSLLNEGSVLPLM